MLLQLRRHAARRRPRRRPADRRLMERLGKEPEFRDGLRVTDAETLDIARMVLVGKVNRDIVVGHQRPRPARRRAVGRGRRPHRRQRPRPRARLRRRRRRRRTPTILERLLAEDLIPVVVHHRRRRRRARRTTSTPTPSPARSPRRSAPRSSSTSPTSRACSRDVDDPASLHLARSTADELAGADRRRARSTGGMIPKVAACVARGASTASARAHILDGRVPHVAAARALHRRRRRHHGHR